MAKTSMYVGPTLTEKQQKSIDALLRNYPDNQCAVIQALHTVDFTDDEKPPAGLLTVHPITAKVHPDSLPLNFFSYLAVFPVLNNKLVDEKNMKPELLQNVIKQYSANPPKLNVRSPLPQQCDGKTWEPEFGEDENAFAGLFKQVKGRDTKYFVCVQAGAPVACKQLREKLVKKPMTFEQLFLDADYNYAHYIAQRNVQRIAFDVAKALKVPIRHMIDHGAHVATPYTARPLRGIASHLQPTCTIERVGKDVGVFNQLAPLNNKSPVLFVYEGPYNGIAVLNVSKVQGHYALPAQSGRLVAEKSKTPLPANGLIWDAMGSDANHPDLNPAAFRDTQSDEFLDGMKQMGWQQHQIYNLHPVAVKIFNPEVKRK